MAVTPVRFVQTGEKAHRPSIANRAGGDMLSGSGYLADGTDFAGFAKADAFAAALTQWAARASVGSFAGRNYVFYGGTAIDSTGAFVKIANGSLVVADNTVSYVERTYDGVVSTNTVGFSIARIPMAKVTAAANAITAVEDWRPISGPFPYFQVEPGETALGLTVTDVRYQPCIPERYGAKGDLVTTGGSASGAQFAAATDSTAGIQAAVNYCVYGDSRRHVTMMAGRYKITDTIHLGYGANSTHGGATGFFNSCTIEGQGYKYRSEGTMSGTAVLPTFSDRPAFNFQGSRGSRIRHMSIVGVFFSTYANNSMGSPGDVPALVDDTVEANWFVATGHANQNSRYAPYAAIAIDAYSGVRPATSYPDVVYPVAIVGVQAQYNKAFSSDVLIEDVHIAGFNTAVVNQPCDADGNGDFTHLRDVYMEQCKWGVSVGNTQSRGVMLDGCKASGMWSVLTNSQHGRQQGKFGGMIHTLNCWGVIQIFQFGAFYATPLTFINLYAESIWRLGDLSATSTSENGIIFDNCELLFSSQNDTKGYPATILGGGQQLCGMLFRGGIMSTYNRTSVFGFNQNGVSFDNMFYVRNDVAYALDYQRLAYNALAGGIVTTNLQVPERMRVRVLPYRLSDGNRSFANTTARWSLSTRDYCCPIYCEKVRANGDLSDRMDLPVPVFPDFAKSSFTSMTLVNGILTITFAARTDQQFMQTGPLPGDVIIDQDTQTVFWVKSRIGLVVLAVQQSNYKMVGGVVTPLVAVSMTVGLMTVKNSRLYTPSYYTTGDFTAASNLITNVARGDGYNGHVTTDILPNDALFIEEQRDLFIAAADNPLSAVAAATLTMTSNAGVRTQVRRRLNWFVKQPPANLP
jgi:hypothetical protein